MRTDIYGQQIYNEMELCLLYLQDPSRTIKCALVENQIKFDEVLQLENAPELIQYNKLDMTVEQFDNQMQSNWLMPEQYKTMDIAQYVLNQCQGEAELQRAGEELLLFQERDMFVLLTLREMTNLNTKEIRLAKKARHPGIHSHMHC